MRSENEMPGLLRVSAHDGKRKNGRLQQKLPFLSHNCGMLGKKLSGTRRNDRSFSLLFRPSLAENVIYHERSRLGHVEWKAQDLQQLLDHKDPIPLSVQACPRPRGTPEER